MTAEAVLWKNPITRSQQVEVKIQCPHHGQEESVTMPDEYGSEFAGVVHCIPDEGRVPRRVRIRLVGGQVTLAIPD